MDCNCFDFETSLTRSGPLSIKWDEQRLQQMYGKAEGIIPMWLADMDYRTAPAITQALTSLAKEGLYGYHGLDRPGREAVKQWYQRRHGWQIESDWVIFLPSVVAAFNIAPMALLEKGSRIIIQPPVYGPFYLDQSHGFELVYNHLKQDENGLYQMDFDALEQQAQSAQALLLCNPHNPIGRSWSKQELERVVDICKRNDVLLISDEIHADLTMPGYTHTVAASLADVAQHSLVLGAASKAFNLPGLATCYAIIPDEQLRKRFMDLFKLLHVDSNLFGMQGLITAYTQGDAWLDALLVALQDNMQYATDFINANVSGVHTTCPQATYLMWLDATSHASQSPLEYFAQRGVGFGNGKNFGADFGRYLRLTAALPRQQLDEALHRMLK